MKIKNFSGVSLIETILYLGLAVLVLGLLFAYGWNVIGINIKSRVVMETERTAQLVAERLEYEIRRADSVDNDNSDFGTPAKLVLLKADEDTVTIEDIGNQVTLKRGSAEPIVLNSPNTEINNFVLTRQVTAGNETQYVGFSFEAVANYPGSNNRSEYQYSAAFSSGSALRK